MKTEKIVKEIISGLAKVKVDIRLEDELGYDLGLDSLDLTELWITIEEKFDISIPEEIIDNFKTVGDIVKYIDNREVYIKHLLQEGVQKRQTIQGLRQYFSSPF